MTGWRFECDRYDDVTNGRPYLVTWGKPDIRASLWIGVDGTPARHIVVSRAPNRRGYSPPSTLSPAEGSAVLEFIKAEWPELKASADRKKEGSQ